MGRSYRRVLTGAVAAFGLIGLVLAGSGPAVAADPKPDAGAGSSSSWPREPVPAGFASWAEVYGFQHQLDVAATAILDAAGPASPSIVASPLNQELRVYYKGAVPAALRTRVTGVPVRFLAAPYTHAELVAQARKLAADAEVATVAPLADGSGLAVTVATGSPAAVSASAVPATTRSRLRAATTVPLTITVGARPHALFSRNADTPGFWGGSAFTSPLGGCTNGFPVSGVFNNYMLTAGHCGVAGNSANIPGQPTPAGSFVADSPCRDSSLIVYNGGVLPSVYTGGTTSTTSAGVVDAVPDFVGNLVTTDGASTGEHFNITVRAVDVFASINGVACQTAGPFTQASYDNASCATAPGDSGGPVYSYFSNTTVEARGTITAGMNGTGNCSVPNGSNAVLYAPMMAQPGTDPHIGLLGYWGVNLLTCGCAPSPVTVPDVVGLSQSSATSAIGAVGLHTTVSTFTDSTCNHLGEVTSQNPAGGTQLLPGSTVDITVGEMPAPPFQCP